MKEQIVVLIPAYNPDEKLVNLVSVMGEKFSHIVVVNDGCDECFSPIFETIRESTDILVHEENKGKGRALKTGYAHIKEKYPQAKGVVTVDADGQHTLTDVEKCCEKFLENEEKAVFGCRDFFSETVAIPPRSRFGNQLTSKLMKFFCDIELSDTQTGLRVVPTFAIPMLLEVKGERYEYEMNAIFALKENGIAWEEVAIEVIYLDNNESSHFNPIRDSLKIYKVFAKFCVASLSSCLLDLGIFTLMVYFLKGLFPLYYIFICTAIARVCSGVVNYLLNRAIFSGKNKNQSEGSAGRYLVLWVGQLMVSSILVNGFVRLFMANETLVKFVVDTLLFFISYKIQQTWVFHNKKQ